VLSDDSDAFELDSDDHTQYGDAELGLDNDDVGVKEVGVDQGDGVEPEDGVDKGVGVEAVVGEDEEGKGDEDDSEISRSNVLISPRGSDEEAAAEVESLEWPCVTKRVPFSKEDMGNPILEPDNTFDDVY